MSVSRLNDDSLRPPEQLLVWAFGISLAAHLFLYGTYEIGHHLGWWKKDLMPAWLKTTQKALIEAKKNQPKTRPSQQEAPLVFVEVDPATATPEAPKDSKYYSSRNSQAANVDATVDTKTPKFDGSQTKIAKTQTVPRAKPVPLQPSAPKTPSPEKEAKESTPKPKGGQSIGDLAMAKPSELQPEKDPGEAQTPVHKRPTTLAEAKLQQSLAGQKMHQDGGVHGHIRLDSLDAKATPFGEYDRELIEAIQNRWYDLLDSKEFSRDRTGRVVVDFNLNFDGRVSEMKIVENDVGDLLSYVCQRAILDPAPFGPWPADMRRMIGADVREVRFTFFYE